MNKHQALKNLLDGKTIKQQYKSKFGIQTNFYKIKNDIIFRKSCNGKVWIETDEINLRGIIEIIDDNFENEKYFSKKI